MHLPFFIHLKKRYKDPGLRRSKKRDYKRYAAGIFIWLLFVTALLHMLSDEGGPGGTGTESELERGEAPVPEPDSGSTIRVVILTTGYEGEIHPQVQVSSEEGLRISWGTESVEWNQSSPCQILPDDVRFQKGPVRIQSLGEQGQVRLESIERGCGTPSYAGVLELRQDQGGIAVINELPVETYLCGVVPSEMPASYEQEALKAQAVCARSYAFRQMMTCAYPQYEAHVNDSTDYQVYNNSQRQESSTRAVAETEGQVVRYQGSIATTYYYSTSCGKTTTMEAWGGSPDGAAGYLKSVEVKGDGGYYEENLPWYRWQAVIDGQTLADQICAATGKDVGTLEQVEVTRRGPGDVALSICARGDAGSVTVDTENKIRAALGGSGWQITRQDGSQTQCGALLPSAFFTIEKQGDTFVLNGGGYGHGIGMSQNGANEMAKQGKNYREILGLFYQGVEIG